VVEVGLGVLGASLCTAVVVSAVSGPTSLAVPKLDSIERASHVLNVAERLLDVVEVGLGRAGTDVVALPVGESVGKDQLYAALDKGIGGAISDLVPAVSKADKSTRQRVGDVVDLLEKFLASEVAAVEGLGADGDGVDLVLVLWNVGGEGLLVRIEALFNVRPDTKDDLETLALGRRKNLLGGVAVAGSVAADNLAARLVEDSIKVLLIVGLVLAGTIGVFGAQGEAEFALGGCKSSRSGGESQSGEGCNAHVGEGLCWGVSSKDAVEVVWYGVAQLSAL
jgi:hypothetical protein